MDNQKRPQRFPRPTTRRLVQLYTALLYNAHLKGFAEGEIWRGRSKGLCVPGLNCYSCPGAVGACPLGALQNVVAASAHGPRFYVVGALLLFGLLLGRVICGWACPMGLLQELLHKLPTPKLKKSRLTRALSWGKYVLLAVFVLAIPIWYALRGLPLPAFCRDICPAGTLEGAVALLLHPANGDKLGLLGFLFTRKFVILVLVLTACVFLYRAFCRFLCPLGAIYGLMARLALVGVKLDRSRCTDCGVCRAVCPMDIRRVGDRECISCGKCVNACPEAAISFRAGKIVLRDSAPGKLSDRRNQEAGPARRRSGRIAWCLALILLAATLLRFNLPSASSEAPSPSESLGPAASYGNAVGEQLPDFTLPTLDGGSFTLSEHRGELVVLNLWATWCGPCVKELPIFEAFAAAHPDVAVLAIHSGPITEDVSAWIADRGYRLPFALDGEGTVAALLGASSMLPHTVVLDKGGTVRYNAPGSVSRELLEELYQQAGPD